MVGLSERAAELSDPAIQFLGPLIGVSDPTVEVFELFARHFRTAAEHNEAFAPLYAPSVGLSRSAAAL
jgi:hypothetical protein